MAEGSCAPAPGSLAACFQPGIPLPSLPRRSCIGGARSGFVACGAEDGKLYIWSSRSGQQLQCLEGHSGCVNAVAWNPALPWLLASAGDDGTVRTYLAPAAMQQ